jgi:hypothetical protein
MPMASSSLEAQHAFEAHSFTFRSSLPAGEDCPEDALSHGQLARRVLESGRHASSGDAPEDTSMRWLLVPIVAQQRALGMISLLARQPAFPTTNSTRLRRRI